MLLTVFLIYFIWRWRKCGIVTVMTFAQPAETCWDVQLSSDSFGSPGSWLAPQQIQMVVSASFEWHIFFKTTGQPAFTRYCPVSGCKQYFGANSELPGTNERMCRRICSSKTSALAGIPSAFAAMAEHTQIPKYFMRHVCAPKLCLFLTAVMSNDVGAAAEYPSTPRPIIGCHHLLLLHLKTECNTMWNRAWAHPSKIVANDPRNGGPFPEGRSCALDRRCTILWNRRPSSHE